MKNRVWFAMLCSLLFSSCGGGGTSRVGLTGTPVASLSPTTLTFGDQVITTSSQPLTATLTNSGTAALHITSIAVGSNFSETNDCGASLASGQNCTITVTFAPQSTGVLPGTLSIDDNATGSPHTASLSGNGVTGTTQSILTGTCWGSVKNGAPQECATGAESVNCPAGQPATPTTESGCLPPQTQSVDTSTSCQFTNSDGISGSGHCLVTTSSGGGSCSVQGQECGAAQLPPCCSGLTCVPASTRAFCEPQ
jgi:hypothetical protein